MLKFFRSMTKSKVGAAFAIGILVLIALAFASGDISNSGGFGGVAGGDRVATVGKERIGTATLNQAATSALERVRQDDPTMSMAAFLANGGLGDVLDSLIDRLAIAAFGREHGIVASDRLVDSEIATMPVFTGPDGKFSEDLFRQMMQQRGISEGAIRDDLEQGLIARQVMIPASVGVTMPREMAKRYASLLTETRTGEIAVLPTLVFNPTTKPTDAEIASFYNANRDRFIRPERRVVRYASFGTDFIKSVPAPTDDEIALRYKANAKKYAASEKRRIVQLVVPTEAAAKAVEAEVASGTALESAAKEKGLSASRLEFFTKDELSSQFSSDLANAVFAAPKGKVIAPARSGLGWHVARVEEIQSTPARSLDQIKSELSAEIAAEKRRAAVSSALERIENSFDEGGSLVDEAKQLGIEIEKTPQLTADGRVYLKPSEQVPDVLRPVLQTAFTMEAEEPQLAEVERGTKFLIYDVTEIAESAPAPLKEITPNVKAAYIHDKASAEAKKAAQKIQADIAEGKSMQDALTALKLPLPPVQRVKMSRPELARLQQAQRQVPRPIALMFNMAEKTAKVQPGPNEQAWFVVSLTDIEPGKITDGDQIIDGARQELSGVMRGEYSDALGRAIRDQMGVERNPAGIQAVRKQLGGES